MVMLETLKRYLGNGWVEADETWTYVSTDDPTGVFKVNADVTGKYSVGMRIKMTNGGNTIHGIITKMGTYGGDEAGYTYITFLHEIDPADNLALHLMANSAITNNYYSTQKAPFGFPVNPRKWTQVITAIGGQSNPVSGSTYSLMSYSVPIGVWRMRGNFTISTQTTGNTYQLIRAGFNNAAGFLERSYGVSGARRASLQCHGEIFVDVSVKTTYYLYVSLTADGTLTSVGVDTNSHYQTIDIECGYL